MALAGVKLDDGRSRAGFPLNCFPVRTSFGRTSADASGAWLIAHHAEQRRRFKAVICSKPRTYSRIKEERKKSELQGTKLGHSAFDEVEDVDDGEDLDEEKILDGFFLMKHCCVEDPTDLCSVNVAGQDLSDVKEDDMMLFDNVAYVNAGENFLPFEAFQAFPALRELEIPLNGLRNLKISHTDFSCLEMLDLSYNNLSQDDLLTLGLLSRVKVLHLTGNNFKNLPLDLSMPYLSREKQVRIQRFASLEVLLLDDNKFMEMTVFAALAGLPKLRHLNMAKNDIFFVPQLKSVEGRVITQDGKQKKRVRHSGSSRRSGRKSRLEKEVELVDLEPKTDVTGTALSLTSQPLLEDLVSQAVASGDADVQNEIVLTADVVTSGEGRENTEAAGNETKIETDFTKSEMAGIASSSFHELMADDFSTSELSARINELENDNDMEDNPALNEKPSLNLLPFPELRYLNLSSNKICEEDSLLAIAAWPMLIELDIYDNPLTNERSGDPPILKRFLQDRLGVKVNRKKPDQPGVTKPVAKTSKVEIRPRHRKITDIVPKVPKLSLEEKMMIELPPQPKVKAADDYRSSPVPGDMNVGKRSVLPPIPVTPKGERNQAWTNQILEEEEEEEEENIFREDEEDGVPEEPSDTFFMTQVDDIDVDQPSKTPQKSPSKPSSSKPSSSKPSSKQQHRSAGATDKRQKSRKESELDDRYKGYEMLLDIEDIEDEPGLPHPSDIQGNIRSLKHTLRHQLVYRDPAVELNKVRKMVQEYRRAPVPPPKPHTSYQEKVDQALQGLKNQSTVQEEKLVSVLRDRKKKGQQFPEAEDLLAQIQRRYNAVRVHSMRDVKGAKEITERALNMLPIPEVKTKSKA